MVRGHAKQQAQEAAAKKAAAAKGGKSQLGEARQKGLKFTCPRCMAQSPNYGVLKEHFQNKHPKDAVPAEDSFSA
ncbi:Zinc finger protein [Pseudozyma hubeiensis]|nr:Zinc finger protein [Pseudozyma hubeiensis]